MAAAKDSDNLLPKKEDYAWVAVKQWLDNELAQYRAPRMSEILQQAKKLGLNAKRARELIQANVPEYRQTTGKVFSTGRPSRIYNTQVLGVYSCDIGFFGRIQPELARLSQTYMAGSLIATDILSRFTLCVPLGPEGKSAKGLVAAFEKMFEEHERLRDYPIKSILFDAERAVTGKAVMRLLQDNYITLHIFRHSRTKSAFAENSIKKLRSIFERWRIHGNEKEWHQSCDEATAQINSLPIIVRGKQLSFAPNDVTQQNLGKFLKELHSLRPEYYFSHFSIDVSMLSFRYEIDDVVSLKLKSVSTKVIGEKRSEQSVDEATWIIVDKVAFFSNKMTIVKCYVLRPHGEYYGSEMVAEEDAIVKIGA